MSKILSCYWNVYINGKILDSSRKKRVDSLDIEELCDGSDTCTIKISDPDFVFIEDNIFVEEAEVSCNIGWHGDTHRVSFDGYISAIDIEFPDSGFPTLTIYCLDDTHLMNKKNKSRSWDNVTRADVVKKIAKEYGFKCVVEQGYHFKKESTISQSELTDIAFCEGLADEEREPFMCKLMDKTLYYVKKGTLKNPSATLNYRGKPYDIVSFTPQINKETKKEEVTSSDINTDDKSVDTAVASDTQTERDTQGDPVNTTSQDNRVYDPKTGTWVKVVS